LQVLKTFAILRLNFIGLMAKAEPPPSRYTHTRARARAALTATGFPFGLCKI